MPPSITKLPVLLLLEVRGDSGGMLSSCLLADRGGCAGPHLRAEVDGEEVLGHQALAHHVVKDRGGPGGGDAGESQPQDAVEGGVVEDGAGLGLSQPKDLVGNLDAGDLDGETGRRGRAGLGRTVSPCPRVPRDGQPAGRCLTVTVS